MPYPSRRPLAGEDTRLIGKSVTTRLDKREHCLNFGEGTPLEKTKAVFDLPFRQCGIDSELHKNNRICAILVIPGFPWPFHSASWKGHSGIAMD